MEFVSKASNPGLDEAPIINCIEIISETAVKSAEALELPKSAAEGDVRELLDAAKTELDRKNYDKALEMYHSALDAAASKDLKRVAFLGMAEIGSPKSLSRIEKYCRDVTPILWEYKELDQDLRDDATRVYIAAANTLGGAKQKNAIKMLNHALTITKAPDIRQAALTGLDNLGYEIGEKAAEEGFITRWSLIGVFPWDNLGNPSSKVFVDEPAIDLSKSYRVGEESERWEKYVNEQPMVNLFDVYGNHEFACAYAYSSVDLPEDREIYLRIGSNDGYVCWWNGKNVGGINEGRLWEADQDSIKVQAKRGKNTVLLKVIQLGGGWGFSVKTTDLDGNAIPYRPGLR
ncbi:MAG: hypothetical protein ABIH23_25285 [bacterium]